MNNKVIFDASALLALIHQEPGAEIVAPLLKSSVMSTINIAECLNVLQRTGVNTKESVLLINDIIPLIIPFDLEQAELQSEIQHKSLSLGDRSCIALGIKLQAPVYTADKMWASLKLNDVEIRLIR